MGAVPGRVVTCSRKAGSSWKQLRSSRGLVRLRRQSERGRAARRVVFSTRWLLSPPSSLPRRPDSLNRLFFPGRTSLQAQQFQPSSYWNPRLRTLLPFDLICSGSHLIPARSCGFKALLDCTLLCYGSAVSILLHLLWIC